MTADFKEHFNAEELVGLFRYKNLKSLYAAIGRGTFPIETYRLGGRIVADRAPVVQFFRDLKDGRAEIKKRPRPRQEPVVESKPEPPPVRRLDVVKQPDGSVVKIRRAGGA